MKIPSFEFIHKYPRTKNFVAGSAFLVFVGACVLPFVNEELKWVGFDIGRNAYYRWKFEKRRKRIEEGKLPEDEFLWANGAKQPERLEERDPRPGELRLRYFNEYRRY